MEKNQDRFDHDKSQGTEICNFGTPSPLEALHCIFCFFSPVFMCNLVRRAPPNLEAKNPVEKIASNPVTSVAVMVFFGPERKIIFEAFILRELTTRVLVIVL